MENPTEKELLLKYLDEVIGLESSKLVGKSLKRFEILLPQEETYDDGKIKVILPLVKKEIKELIYEAFREMKDIFYAYGKGLEMSQIRFITSKEKK